MDAAGLATLLALVALCWALARAWPGALRPLSLLPPVVVTLLFLALPTPPALLRAAATVAAAQAEPYRLLDAESGLVVSLFAWAVAGAFGAERALVMVAALAAGLAVALLGALAFSCGLSPRSSLLAAILLPLLPTFWLPIAAGAPTAMAAAAAELLLLVHLARRLPHLEGARDTAAVCLFAAVPQALSATAVVEVVLLAGAAATLAALRGHPRRALRLGASVAVASAAVAAARAGLQLIGGGTRLLMLPSAAALGWGLLLAGPIPLLLAVPGVRRLPSATARMLLAAGAAALALLLAIGLGVATEGRTASVLPAMAGGLAVGVAAAWPSRRVFAVAAAVAVAAWAAWGLPRAF